MEESLKADSATQEAPSEGSGSGGASPAAHRPPPASSGAKSVKLKQALSRAFLAAGMPITFKVGCT